MIGPVVYLTGVYARWSKLLGVDQNAADGDGGGWRRVEGPSAEIHGF